MTLTRAGDPGSAFERRKLRVAAIFTSYNRKAVALECVRRLREQSRAPDLVVIADNASDDGTAAALGALHWEPLEVVEVGGNLGNAGGVRVAMEHAFTRGADAVWILDDDSWPRPEALQHLLEPPWDPQVVRHSLQVDPLTGRFTWPLLVDRGDGRWKLAWSEGELTSDFLRTRTAWTGALISREVREIAGPVMGELFIRGEDEEYPWRIEAAGIPTRAVRRSVLDHPGPANLIHWSLLGKNLFLERGLQDWKLYYKIRNMIWLKRRQSGAAGAFAIFLAYAAGTAAIDGPRRLALVWRAALAGWSGKLGKWDGH